MIEGFIGGNMPTKEQILKYKMARLNKIRICKFCGKEIDNSDRKIHKRTKFCNYDCAEDYNYERKLRRQNGK